MLNSSCGSNRFQPFEPGGKMSTLRFDPLNANALGNQLAVEWIILCSSLKTPMKLDLPAPFGPSNTFSGFKSNFVSRMDLKPAISI